MTDPSVLKLLKGYGLECEGWTAASKKVLAFIQVLMVGWVLTLAGAKSTIDGADYVGMPPVSQTQNWIEQQNASEANLDHRLHCCEN